MLVGYKLIDDKTGKVVQEWGGIYNHTPDAPTVIKLPNGDTVLGAQAGNSYGGCSFVAWYMDPPVVSLSTQDVDQERDRRVNSGIIFEGLPFQTTPAARESITTASVRALVAIVRGVKKVDAREKSASYTWITTSNKLVELDAQQLIDLGNKVAEWQSANVLAARAIKDLPKIPADFRDDKYWPAYGA